jgi:F-type H+-transporting ATPase subunit epsilon
MADKIRLRLVTPSRMLLDEEVDEITAPGALGEFGVLPNHIAFLTLLEIGEMTYKQGTERQRLALNGGYAEVLDNVVTVLANAAEYADEIDVARVQKAKEEAEAKLAELSQEDKEVVAARGTLRWASVRLEVAGRPGHT